MLWAKILFFPDPIQERILLLCQETYLREMRQSVKYLLEGKNLAESKMSNLLTSGSKHQIFYDATRRAEKLRSNEKTEVEMNQEYCRWSGNFKLTEDVLTLELGSDFGKPNVSLACIVRPFQKNMIDGCRINSCTVKYVKNHWYAFLPIMPIAVNEPVSEQDIVALHF